MADSVSKGDKRILYSGLILDAQDPMNLGRLRVEPEDKSILAVIQAYNITEKTKWNMDPNNGPIDPFVVKPLLPLFEVKICKAWDGLVVPIPTLPSPLIVNLAVESVLNIIDLTALS